MANDTPDALVAATLAVAVRGEDEATRREDANRVFDNYRYLRAKMAATDTADGDDATGDAIAKNRPNT